MTILLGYLVKRTVNNVLLRLVFYFFLIGMYVYSGVGISINSFPHKDSYFFPYIMFILCFTVFGIVVCNSKYAKISNGNKEVLSIIVYDKKWLIELLAIIYIVTFLIPLFYPYNRIMDIFNVQRLISDFSTVSFSERVMNKSNGLINFIRGPLRILLTPSFYLFLFQYRKKTVRFISYYLIPIYLKAVYDTYISRNEIAFFILFIFFYLWYQKIIKRKILVLISLIGAFVILPWFYDFTFFRTGSGTTLNSNMEKIISLFSEETSYVNLLHYAKGSLTLNEKISFLLYIITCPIPNFLFFGMIEPIALSEIFTKIITGLNYGSQGYYLLLPTVFGEGIMLFGVFFSWLYSFILGFFYLVIGKFMSEFKELKFMLIAYSIDIFRQTRGGSQFVLTTWIPCIVYFILFLMLIKILNRSRWHNGINFETNKR